MRKPLLLTIAAIFVIGLAACTPSKNSGAKTDRSQNNNQLTTYQNNQPAPSFNKSQLRQTAIEIETAQAKSTVTTSFFFNQGVAEPVYSCPSVGLPVPTTDQLTSPSNKYNGDSDAVIPQIDPNGVYAGDSSGTYVICTNAQGQGYFFYWEGFVMSVTGSASWNTTTHQIEINGAPTAQVTTKVG